MSKCRNDGKMCCRTRKMEVKEIARWSSSHPKMMTRGNLTDRLFVDFRGNRHLRRPGACEKAPGETSVVFFIPHRRTLELTTIKRGC